MDFTQRDSSYHRRLGLISGLVVVLLAAVVVGGQRYVRSDSPKFVGWKGEMELLPEITIEPEVFAPEIAPVPEPPRRREAALAVAPPSDFETTPPSDAKPTEAEPLDVNAEDASVREAMPRSRPSSYSETYVILRTVKPKYPEHERDRGIEGSVTVELLVDELGLVARAYAVNLIGPESFQESALDAVRQFEFQPPIVDGEPSTMWIKFLIKFRMAE